MSKLDCILEGKELPPQYKVAKDPEISCDTCLHYSSKRCMKFGLDTSADMVCDMHVPVKDNRPVSS